MYDKRNTVVIDIGSEYILQLHKPWVIDITVLIELLQLAASAKNPVENAIPTNQI